MSKKSARTHEVKIEKDPYDKAIEQLYSSEATDKIVRRMDEYQRAYYLGTKEKRVSIVDAKAGTGKTTVAFASGLEELRSRGKGSVNRLMYVRFPDDEMQSLGYLPGGFEEKSAQYFEPAYLTLAKCGLQYEAVDALREHGLFEFMMANMMRGTDYENTFVIIDESQNAKTIEALRKVLTRFHDSCRIVLIGHSKQQDGRVQKYSGFSAFQAYQAHLLKKRWVQAFPLIVDYRGELCRWADDIDETLSELERG